MPPDDRSDGGVAAAPPGVDLVSGSGTLRGGDVEMNVQIGHGVSQERVSGGDTTVEGNAPVKP